MVGPTGPPLPPEKLPLPRGAEPGEQGHAWRAVLLWLNSYRIACLLVDILF